MGQGCQVSLKNPKTFKTERGCPFLIKINKKESTYNNQKKKSKKEKITCNIIGIIIQKKENKKKKITDNKYVVFKYKKEFKNIAFIKIQYKLNKLQRSSDLNVRF